MKDWVLHMKFKIEKPKKIVLFFLLLVVFGGGVVAFGEYQKYAYLKEARWDVQKREIEGLWVPDVRLTWVSAQDKVRMDIPLVIENPTDRYIEFVGLDFDIFVWGRYMGSGEIPGVYKIPAGKNASIWIRDFGMRRKEFENYAFTAIRGGNYKVDIAIEVTVHRPLPIGRLDIEARRVETEYTLEEERAKEIALSYITPFVRAPG